MRYLESQKKSIQSEIISLDETLSRVESGQMPAFIDLLELLKKTEEIKPNNDSQTRDLKNLQSSILLLQAFEGKYLDRSRVNYSDLDYLNLKEALLSNNPGKFRAALTGLYANWIGRSVGKDDIHVDFYVDRDFSEIVKIIQEGGSGSFSIRLGADMLWLCINIEQNTINIVVSNFGYSPLDDIIKKNYIEKKQDQLAQIELASEQTASLVRRVAVTPLQPLIIPKMGVGLEGHLPLRFQALVAAINAKNINNFLDNLLEIELSINRAVYNKFPELPKYMEFFQLQQKLIRPRLAKETALKNFLMRPTKFSTYTYVCRGGGYNKLVFTRKKGYLEIYVGDPSLEDFKEAASKMGLPLRVAFT